MELIIAFISTLLIGVVVIVNNKRSLRSQLVLSVLGTAYMLIHAVLYPASNSKFFAFIGVVFIIQHFKKSRGQSEV